MGSLYVIIVVVAALSLFVLGPWQGVAGSAQAAAWSNNNNNNNNNDNDNRGRGGYRNEARCLSFQDTMDSCLGPLGGSLGLRPGDQQELLSDLNATKALCLDNKLQDAMACLEQVFNNCASASKAYRVRQKGSKPPPSLNLVMAKGKWKNSMERLCANIDYLQEHEECTRNIAVESSHCIHAESQRFMDKSSRIFSKALREGRSGHKQLMKLGCQFAHSVMLCYQDHLDKEPSCPCRYRHLIIDIVMNSMPPFCQPDIDYYYYVYNECMEDEEEEDFDDNGDDGDEFGAYVGGGGSYSGSDPKYGSGSGRRPPGSNRHGGGGGGGAMSNQGSPAGEVVIIQKPVMGDMKDEGHSGDRAGYKVHDVGKSQGHMGGSGADASAGLAAGWRLWAHLACLSVASLVLVVVEVVVV